MSALSKLVVVLGLVFAAPRAYAQTRNGVTNPHDHSASSQGGTTLRPVNLTVSGTLTADTTATFRVGSSSTAGLGGNLYVSTIPYGNVATSVETFVDTITLPANALYAKGQKVKIEAWGRAEPSGSATRNVRLYFGGWIVSESPSVSNSGDRWQSQATVFMGDSSTQVFRGWSTNEISNTQSMTRGTSTAPVSAPINVRASLKSNVGANDLWIEGLSVELWR